MSFTFSLQGCISVMMKAYLPIILICSLLIAFQIAECLVGGFPVNCAPIVGLFVCSFFLHRWKGLLIAFSFWALCYPVLSWLQGSEYVFDGLLSSIVGLLAVAGSTFGLRTKFGNKSSVILTSLIGAIAFYFVTNCVSWLGMPIYEKNLSGFIQAQWLGHPSFPLPTWVFLKNSLIGNGVFVGLIVLSFSKWESKALLSADSSVC